MSSTSNLLSTPLTSWHVENGGRMVDFAGWSMPVQYGSIVEEHHQTRNAFGLFDVSHMGRLYFSGSEVGAFLDSLTTRRVSGIDAGKIRYSLMTNEAGCILDDVLVYRLADSDEQPFYMMVVNASNRTKIVEWLKSNLPQGCDIEIDDRTESTAMIAVQGPKANEAVTKIASLNPDTLSYYTGVVAKIGDAEVIISRTGYTGEDGCELIVPGDAAVSIWSQLIELGKAVGGGASGLASRDSLRLEAAMPLYGHELTEDINAAQADLKFAINVKDREFIGRSAILAARKDESLRKRVGFVLKGKRAARENCPVVVDGNVVGEVTSGAFAPTVQNSISMGYVDPAFAEPGTKVQFDIRGKFHDGEVVQLPFYKRD
ncbi:glycine cleavage system aminomethyltransferase GcvT [Mariniblastus fucicola]|uniref:Aminomethyltransferase n=1 Tax=Mariniblastus fucicola TaxID=980251 RepID=A0A5B9PF35_9BACT|nr:glycine cleavage system aminomethyltransferase GcvT [Mariniblastus fucicola]QEG23805.1 Glycine cleavage system T protein [Mariniblastus fucicola]